ncbi:MAG: hypothetical protein K0S03_340 [Burkholderiales bacterium]|nr:hypothetical protein [Burkholderiales bacterium]
MGPHRVEVDVAGELAVGAAVDAHVDHAGTGFDHLAGNEFRPARGGNQYVGAAGDVFKVFRFRVADRHRRVLLQQQQRERLADDVGAADHYRAAARHRDAGMLEQAHHAGRRAGHEPGRAGNEGAEVHGVEAVDVLGGRNQRKYARRIDVARQRQLHQDAVDCGIGIERLDSLQQFGLADRCLELEDLRLHPGFLAGERLVADVDARGRIVAGEDHGEAGPYAALRKMRNAFLDAHAHCGRE